MASVGNGKPHLHPRREYCTERTPTFCNGPAGPCDGPKSTDTAESRFGNPGDCSAGTFAMLPGETELNIRVLVDHAIAEAFVMKGRWTVWTALCAGTLQCCQNHG